MSSSTTHEEDESLFIPLNLENFRLGGAKSINPMLETLH